MRSLLEHPEDLGRVTAKHLQQQPLLKDGMVASIWGLDDVRTAHGNSVFWSVAGYQCQLPDTDRSKPTRVLSDLEGIVEFGYKGWPTFDAAGFYTGPLPDNCGHTGVNRHKQKMIGQNAKGGFNTAPTAAYPAGMCLFFATLIFDNWLRLFVNAKSKTKVAPFGIGFSRNLVLSTSSSTTAPLSTSSACFATSE